MDTKHILSVPIGELTEINLDGSKLKGRDILEAQEEYEALTGTSVGFSVLELDKKFQAFMASKIAGISYDTILNLPAKDFSAVTLEVQRFLLGRG